MAVSSTSRKTLTATMHREELILFSKSPKRCSVGDLGSFDAGRGAGDLSLDPSFLFSRGPDIPCDEDEEIFASLFSHAEVDDFEFVDEEPFSLEAEEDPKEGEVSFGRFRAETFADA